MSERPYRRAYALLRRVAWLRPALEGELRELLERLREPLRLEPQPGPAFSGVPPWALDTVATGTAHERTPGKAPEG